MPISQIGQITLDPTVTAVNDAVQSEIAFQAAQPNPPASQAEYLVFLKAFIDQGFAALAIGQNLQLYNLPDGTTAPASVQDIFRRIAALATQALAADPDNIVSNTQGATLLSASKAT